IHAGASPQRGQECPRHGWNRRNDAAPSRCENADLQPVRSSPTSSRKVMLFARPLAELIAELERLPGVGPKSAQRLAYHLLRVSDAEAGRLADSIKNAKLKLRFCARCQNISEQALCETFRDMRRDSRLPCVWP